jgi:hypothetical protein
MAIRVKHPKDHPDVQASKEDDYKGKYYKDKKKSARRFADTVQTMMARKRSATEGSFRKGGRAGYDTGKIVKDTDTSGKPRPPQVPLNQRPDWKRRHLLDKDKLNVEKEKRKKAMQRLQLGKKYNIGGRANLLEEMGRLDAERMNPNRRAEKHRVIGELNKGYKSGGAVLKGKKVGCQIK